MANYNSAKQKAYDVILHLVDNFQNGIKSKNETETRRYYIDKFFEALGWDVGNEKGKREVIHEDIVKVKGKTKFPDYGFYFKGKRVFFVEAKDTKVDIKNDSRPAFQLRSYAWSAKLGVSILTDFEEFAVYDCTVRPKENDRTDAGRIKYFTYEDYLKEDVFDYIYDLFERENVANGSLDVYSENLCNRKGSETVDVHFLSTLDELRTKLAVVISKLNREMSEKDINYAVQQIIDRIIFLRVAEDRNVENYGLLALANPKNKNEDDFKNYGFNGENSYYENLNYIFDRANEKYNSGLFDEDAIVRNLNIDDKTIKDIIDELYTPKNPYQFSVIPVEIIGNAYEQFLGKTISIDKNHKAVIELKPEVRKAGGVYYTPEYIVDYIVANTVGEAIKGKTPDEIVNIKILDPACGSGSFLLGAYKYLLNYHKEYFLKNKTKKYMGSRYEIIDESGNLALWVRKQILINNIFGVDIDSNAVEVAKLSLLLKSFEDSFNVNEYGQGSLLNEKILPSLDNNIKCGNSLIGNDFYESHLDLDDAALYKINCFDWDEEFKSIFKGGGFDVVIGNPPYGAELSEIERNYLEKKFSLSNTNTAALFLGVLKNFLKDNCRGGYIIPKSFIYASNWESSRDLMIDDLFELVDCGKVWKEVKLEQVITLFEKGLKNDSYITSIREDKEIKRIGDINKNTYKEFGFYLNAVSNDELNIAYKMNVSKKYINDYCINKAGGNYQSKMIDEEKKDTLKVLGGKHINRYYYPNIIKGYLEKKYIVNDKGLIKNNSILVQNIVAHIMNPVPHIKIIAMPSSILNNKDEYILVNKVNQLENISNLDTRFILAIVNSKLISWYSYRFIFGLAIRTVQFDNPTTSRIPMPVIDLSNSSHKEVHDKIVVLVDSIIELNKKVNTEKNPNSLNMINRQILACEKQLDNLIFSIYNLNDEERRIINE